jgi:hypothetical protein
MGPASLIDRVRNEFLEMPGLKLTLAQAARFLCLDGCTCREVLEALIDCGFLRRTNDSYIRNSG